MSPRSRRQAALDSDAPQGPPPAEALPPDTLVFETTEYAVPPGKEMYMCYTMRLDEDVAIDRFTYDAQPGVHHIVLVNPLVPEADAPFECDVLFKQTWIPLIATGTGDADISTPEGAAFQLNGGAQLLVQLHLLNAGSEEIRGKARILMHENHDADVVRAGIYAFGTQTITLPPMQTTTIQNDCTLDKDIHAFAVFPHMHRLGSAITFSSGQDAGSLVQRFSMDSSVSSRHTAGSTAACRSEVCHHVLS